MILSSKKLETKNLQKIREINISNGPFKRSQRSEININYVKDLCSQVWDWVAGSWKNGKNGKYTMYSTQYRMCETLPWHQCNTVLVHSVSHRWWTDCEHKEVSWSCLWGGRCEKKVKWCCWHPDAVFSIWSTGVWEGCWVLTLYTSLSAPSKPLHLLSVPCITLEKRLVQLHFHRVGAIELPYLFSQQLLRVGNHTLGDEGAWFQDDHPRVLLWVNTVMGSPCQQMSVDFSCHTSGQRKCTPSLTMLLLMCLQLSSVACSWNSGCCSSVVYACIAWHNPCFTTVF